MVDSEKESVDAVFNVQKIELFKGSTTVSLSAPFESRQGKEAYVLLTP